MITSRPLIADIPWPDFFTFPLNVFLDIDFLQFFIYFDVI